MRQKKKSIIGLLFCVLILLPGCSYSKRMKEWYSDDTNYRTIVCKIKKIIYDDYYKALYFHLDFNEEKYNLIVKEYKIIEANENILKERNFYKEVFEGNEIIIIVAPRIFGDGYWPPIVALQKQEKSYLDFEVGKKNLLDSIK